MNTVRLQDKPMAAMVLALWLLCTGSGGAFAQADTAPPCSPSQGPVYLNGRDAGKTSVVVFVHGVLSDAVGAWSASGTTSWPCLLRAEPVFATSNIYLYAYRAAALGQSPRIEKVATHLMKDMQADGVLAHAHITFVAHSMGGLVVSRMLLQLRNDPAFKPLLERVRLVQFYGPPATGADIANLASQFSDNPQFDEMRKREQPQELVDQWTSVKWPFRWYCLAEGKRTGWAWGIGTLVVSRESAAALCRDRPQAFEVMEGFDHVSMVKPASVQDEPHRALFRNFKSCVASGIARTGISSEAATPDGQLLLGLVSRLRSSLIDDSEVGRLGMQQLVQDALYQSGAWSDQYFLPKDLARPGLTQADHERLSGRVFANEFVRHFQPRADKLKPAWVTRLSAMESNLPDGQLLELRNQWLLAGWLQDGDYAIALDVPTIRGQVLVVGGIQPDAAGRAQARIRGIVVVPPEPQTCD